jgi:hypothetical protein
VLIAVIITGIALVPLFTPVFSPSTIHDLGLDDANKDLGGMLGWHHIEQQIAGVVHGLPRNERNNAVILTGDYSEAGALDFWRTDDQLPRAYSGHNTYWYWGRPHGRNRAVVAVGMDPRLLHKYWSDCKQVVTLGRDGVPIDPQERGDPIDVCRDQKQPWSSIWPRLRHYN